jgi:hypothetical protein
VNVHIVETRVRQAIREARRARIRAFASLAAAIGLAVAAIFGAVLSIRTGDNGAVAFGLVGVVGAVSSGVWAAGAMRSVARWDQRVVQVVAAAADRAVPRSRAA